MQIVFTAGLNKLAWKIKKAQNISWGAAFRMAMELCTVPEVDKSSTVLGTWTPQAHRAVAGHFWGLSKAYKEVGDTGRSIAMCKVSKTLFAMWEERVDVNFHSLIRMKGVKESIASEIINFYTASYHGVPTTRSEDLINRGAASYQSHIILPRWTF